MKQEIVDKPGAINLKQVEGFIKFNNVCFSYNEKMQTLKDINIDIKSGQIVAFVGPSGAGKTTITYLLPRFYDVNSGSITIDGHDIRDVTIESLRRQIGMVTQDTYLFNASIRQNLLFSKPSATEDEVFNVCKTANIHDMITSLPDGYDTIVGDRE